MAGFAVLTLRAFGVQAEIVEIEMPPVPGVVIDHPHAHHLVLVFGQIHHHAPEVLLLDAAGAVKHRPGAVVHDLDTGFRIGPAADKETGPGFVDLERLAGQRALGWILQALKTTQPIASLMLAAAVAAPLGHHIPLDGLPFKRLALRLPVAQVAGLKIQVQHPAIQALGQFPRIGCLGKTAG